LGKKEKDEPKKQVPKSLDDFMANISGKSSAGSTASKKGMTAMVMGNLFTTYVIYV